MKHSLTRFLAALLVAALLAGSASAWAEDPQAGLPMPAEAEQFAPEGAEEAADPLEEEIAFFGDVDPQAAPALDAGDTGLVVEYEEPSAEQLGDDEIDLPVGDVVETPVEPPTEEAPQDNEGGMILAGPEARVGYAAVAVGTPVFADAALSVPMGAFPEGATVYVEAVEADGAALRIRFDTEQARCWALELPAGYISPEPTLAYTDAEAAALVAALAADARTREANGALIPWAAWSEAGSAVAAEAENVTGLGVDAHTQEEVQAFVNAHPSYTSQINIFSVAATDEPYTVGYLSPVNQRSALNMLNQIRYIVGVNADVALLDSKAYDMAATALVLRLNGALSHYPARPAALADAAYDDLYNRGYAGAGSSNIAMGYTVTGAMLAYMADADDKNRVTVGHRRWIINPRMGGTVFGANGRFSSMYAHDRTGGGTQTKVAWPAQQMPIQYFSVGDPWSVSYGRVLDASQVQVDLVRLRDGRSWHFSQTASDGYFNVENSYYGRPGCVIFQPDGLEGLLPDEYFNVSVTDGANGEITRYTVHFFSLDQTACKPLNRLDVTAVKTDVGNAVSWSADERATGYYVCRRVESTLYQIVADVTEGTSFLDTAVSPDALYYYQVYAHTDSLTSVTATGVAALPPKPDRVVLDHSGTVKLYTNATLKLAYAFEPAYAEAAIQWTSSNTKVAKVNADGLVTPVNKGTATIAVTADNGMSAQVKVKVTAPPKPTAVKLDRKGTVKLNLSDKLKLTATLTPAAAATTFTWKSSNTKIAKVSKKGVVTPVKPGTVTITVTTANGKKTSVKVKVVDPTVPTKVKLDASGTVKLYVGDKLNLEATISPATAAKAKLTWSSSNKKIAKVSAKGVVTALKKGTVTITVKTANGKKDTVKIKVVE